MKTIEDNYREVLEKKKDQVKTKRFSEAIEKFKELEGRGLVKKRGFQIETNMNTYIFKLMTSK